MSNHFHILVKIPARVTGDDRTLFNRATAFYGPKHSFVKHMTTQMDSQGKLSDELRVRLLARMGDVSCFLKELKQRFSSWYNRQNDRYGTLWAERFRSTIVENAKETAQLVAAYIDLNPVRAGIVQDPKDYRFSNYTEAVCGGKASQEAIIGCSKSEYWHRASADYRERLFTKGGTPGRIDKMALDREAFFLEVRNGSKLSAVMNVESVPLYYSSHDG